MAIVRNFVGIHDMSAYRGDVHDRKRLAVGCIIEQLRAPWSASQTTGRAMQPGLSAAPVSAICLQLIMNVGTISQNRK